MSFFDKSASELLRLLQDGSITSVELTRRCLDRIEQTNPTIGAFLSVSGESALACAEALDGRRAAGETLGPLAGLPVAVKDNLCTAEWPTTCGSRMLEQFRPPYDATVVEHLKAAGAVLIGKTNLDEFAMGGSTETSALGVTRNPWDHERTPGGSSGGAAACLAASMVPLSVGSDTGGSIRQPAAFCGVVGLKPSYGRVSRYGLVAFASSLDQIGPLARTVEDVARLLEVLAGHDPRDSTSADQPVPPYSQLASQPLDGLRIGWVPEHLAEGVDEQTERAVREALDEYARLGATIKEVSLPHAAYAVATYYIIAPSEASSNLARYDGVHYGYRTEEQALFRQWRAERERYRKAGDQAALDDMDTPLVRMYRQTRAEGFGAEVKRRIMLGTYALSAGYYDAYYLKALKVRRLIRKDFDEAYREVDVIAGPTAPAPAFRLGEFADDPLSMYLQDLFTVSANLTGGCALSLPCGFTREGLPIGLQLQAPPFEETRLLQAAYQYQRETDWHLRRPATV